MTMQDISLWKMVAVFGLLIIPLGILYYTNRNLVKEAAWALVRMTVQLILIGLYLKYLFEINSILLNFLWMFIAIVVADFSIIRQAQLCRRIFFFRMFMGTAFASLTVTLIFVIVILQPDPLYDARYLVPIFGMTLGNCLRGNVIAMERFFNGIRTNEREFVNRLLLGATKMEAVRPFMQQAMQAALSPMFATMATMGIVALPGMMTGQILGGALPWIAIKYQIAIMICIFAIMTLGAFLNIMLVIPVGFDKFGMLRKDIFAD